MIVGLDAATPSSRALLEAAAGLADRMEAELVGLFVENVDLLHLAGLPFTREVGFPSATSRELDVERMERALRAVARDAHRMLASVAERAPRRWSFRVTRGVLVTELLSAVAEGDLVLVNAAPARRPGGAPEIRVISARDPGELRAALQNETGGILLLTGDGDDAVDAALRELVSLVPGSRKGI